MSPQQQERDATVTQCRSCPWRVDCDPLTDIPNGYSVELHEGLRGTIAEPGRLNLSGACRIMACHYSKVGQEIPCAGWLANQIGEGNNIAIRLKVIHGQMPRPILDGEQHRTFEDTLPVSRPSSLRRPRQQQRGK